MSAALKIKSGSSRFFDQEQVSLPPLGQRYGNNPTVSQSHVSNDFQLCREEWHCGGRTHPFIFLPVLVSHQTSFIFLSVFPFFSPDCFQGGVLSFKSFCETLVLVTSHQKNYFKNHKQLILLLVGRLFVCLWVLGGFLVWFPSFFFFLFLYQKDNKASFLHTAVEFC